MSDAAKADVAKLAMQAFQHAAESWSVGGGQLMTILVTREGAEQKLQRVDMTSAGESLAVARDTVMHTAEAKPSHFTGMANWLRWRELVTQ